MIVDVDACIEKLAKKYAFYILVAIITSHNIPRDVAQSIAIDYLKCPDEVIDDRGDL